MIKKETDLKIVNSFSKRFLVRFMISIFGVIYLSIYVSAVSSCQDLDQENTIYILTQNVSSTGTCFNIKANNITLDCQGHQINYSQSTTGYGISSSGYNNITIKDCKIVQGSSSSNSYAIYLNNVDSSNVINNSITTFGSASFSIYLYWYSDLNIVLNNIITTSSTSIYLYKYSSSNIISKNIVTTTSQAWAIALRSGSNSNTISDNNITTLAGASLGIILYGSCSSNTISNNTITTSNTGDGMQIRTSSNYNNIANNTIITSGNTAYGIQFLSSANYNNLINNTITTSGSNSNGIEFYSSDNNYITNNTITTSGSSAHGLYLSISNDKFTGNIIDINETLANTYSIYLLSSTNSIFRENTMEDVYMNFNYSGDFNISGVAYPSSDPIGYSNISKYLSISGTNWIYLTISYLDSDFSSLNESTLRILRYNGTSWDNDVGTSTKGVNQDKNYVYANITKFSDFGVFGSTLPIYSSFFSDPETTNFSAVSDITTVQNMTLATSAGKIEWINNVNAEGENYDKNIKIGVGFVSVNASALHSTINNSANITIEALASCTGVDVYYANEFYSTLQKIKDNGVLVLDGESLFPAQCDDLTPVGDVCNTITCSGGVLMIEANHFDSFGGEGTQQQQQQQTIPEFNKIGIILIVLICIISYIIISDRK